MSQGGSQRSLPQSKDNLLKTYARRLRGDVQSIQDNFTEILKLAKVCNGGSSTVVSSNNPVFN